MKSIINFIKSLFGIKPQATVKPIGKAKSADVGVPTPPTFPNPKPPKG